MKIDQELFFLGGKLFNNEADFEKWCLIELVGRPIQFSSDVGPEVTYFSTIRGFRRGKFGFQHQLVSFWGLKRDGKATKMLVTCSTLLAIVVGILAIDYLKQ